MPKTSGSLYSNAWALNRDAETVAARRRVEARRICLELADRRFVSFTAAKYPLLGIVQLRLNGLTLHREELDEDIWVDDAVCGRFPVDSKNSI